MTNSREKGKRGERMVAALLTYHGFQAYRAQQYHGAAGDADVKCPDLERLGFHLEVKNVRIPRFNEWFDQARRDAPVGQTPLIFWKRPRQPWLVLFEAESFLDWLAQVLAGDDDDDTKPEPEPR